MVLWKHELIASMGNRHVKSVKDLFSRPSMVEGSEEGMSKALGCVAATHSQHDVTEPGCQEIRALFCRLLKTRKMLDVRYLCFKNSILGVTCGNKLEGEAANTQNTRARVGIFIEFLLN